MKSPKLAKLVSLLVLIAVLIRTSKALRPFTDVSNGKLDDHTDKVLKNLFDEELEYSSSVQNVHQGSENIELYNNDLELEKPEKATKESLKALILDIFAKQRHDSNLVLKDQARKKIIESLEHLELDVKTQSFSMRYGRTIQGLNIIGVLPGKFRGTANDKVLVFGAHYDTVRGAPGVDDNGSGSAAVLKAAQLLSPFRGKLASTILFTFFDLEEYVSRMVC